MCCRRAGKHLFYFFFIICFTFFSLCAAAVPASICFTFFFMCRSSSRINQIHAPDFEISQISRLFWKVCPGNGVEALWDVWGGGNWWELGRRVSRWSRIDWFCHNIHEIHGFPPNPSPTSRHQLHAPLSIWTIFNQEPRILGQSHALLSAWISAWTPDSWANHTHRILDLQLQITDS